MLEAWAGESTEEKTALEHPLDINLLTFGKFNKQQALHIMETEIDSCLYVEKFEFFQKLVVLNAWLDIVEEKSETEKAIKQYNQV